VWCVQRASLCCRHSGVAAKRGGARQKRQQGDYIQFHCLTPLHISTKSLASLRCFAHRNLHLHHNENTLKTWLFRHPYIYL
jgi:hypothetical protein